MGDERAAAEQARRRLVRLGDHGAPAPPSAPGGGPGPAPAGWVPADPALDASATGDGPALRRRAMSAALVGYTAAHGHPLEHREPVPGGRTRWSPSGRQVLVASAALVAILAALGLRTALTLPSTTVETQTGTALEADGAAAASPAPSVLPSAAVGAAGATLVVHVVGEVLSPGLLTLPEGARVADAVTAAGGALPTADLTAVNLARLLVDGEQLVVPRPGEGVTAPGAAGADGPGPGAGPAGLVDLNSADLATLDGLPGIGPVLAQRILDRRTEHGPFTSVEELTEVTGIGPSLLERLRDAVRV